MKIIEKTVDNTTCIRMRSGSIVEVHIITQEDGNKTLAIEHENTKLAFNDTEIKDFVKLFDEFLNSVK
ncbi:MAG: hypothetical protein EAX86_02800 [Candidatus Heimdallarchaeota archaeon]|nr:hypothetical protein [Candidatus Heimdallarchaeota archaeon]